MLLLHAGEGNEGGLLDCLAQEELPNTAVKNFFVAIDKRVLFLAAYTAVKQLSAMNFASMLFLAAYTAVKGPRVTADVIRDFLAAYTAVKERCYSSTP